MLVRFFANCVCVISLCVILWGASPIFAGCLCDLSDKYACDAHEDAEGNCLEEAKGKQCSTKDLTCTCASVTIRQVKGCRCYKN
jgi:hypothetical protein